MARQTLSLALLSLFTDPCRAAGIDGDLTEQSHARGHLWFVGQLLHTAVHLFRATVLRNSASVLLLSYALYELMAKAHFHGIRPLAMHLLNERDLPRLAAQIPICLLSILLPFGIGLGLVRCLPALGASAAIGASVLAYARVALLDESFTAFQVTVYFALPMMLGALVASLLRPSNAIHPIEAREET